MNNLSQPHLMANLQESDFCWYFCEKISVLKEFCKSSLDRKIITFCWFLFAIIVVTSFSDLISWVACTVYSRKYLSCMLVGFREFMLILYAFTWPLMFTSQALWQMLLMSHLISRCICMEPKWISCYQTIYLKVLTTIFDLLHFIPQWTDLKKISSLSYSRLWPFVTFDTL